MSWTAPRTWVVGETLTAALLNTHVRDNELDIDSRLDGHDTDIAGLNTAPQLVINDTTEYTTTQTGSYATLKSETVSIPATSGIIVKFAYRKTTGAAASVGIAVQLNLSSGGFWNIGIASDAANAAGNGYAVFDIPPYIAANYDDAAIGYSNFQNSAGTNTVADAKQGVARPSSTITAVIIEGICNTTGITLGVQGIRVYSLA